MTNIQNQSFELSLSEKVYLKTVRERISTYGAEEASIRDLLALTIGSTNNRAMDTLSGIHPRELLSMSAADFKTISGIGPALSERLEALMALAKKLTNENFPEECVIRSPDDASQYLMARMRYLSQEEFVAIALNTKNHVLAFKTIFKGSLNASISHPREIFKFAIHKNAASLIVAHNHPSGDPTPSQEDFNVTKRLREVGKIMGIDVLDHIIIGGDDFFSMQENGHIQ
jgi:DNA repair protein RadC